MTIRVSVPDVWDTIELSVNPEQTVAQVKHEALRRAVGERVDPGQFVVKYRGGQVLDETRTLASLGVRDRAPLIVLPARRRPVR